MFKPSHLQHSSSPDMCQTNLADSFGVLCWNVYKKNKKSLKFQNFLDQEVKRKGVDLILFQEASFRDKNYFELTDFSYDAAANLEFRKEFYGVLSASRVESSYAKAYLSQGKEGLFGPHKSLLVSKYSFKDSNSVLILNIHAINFRETKHYIKELERVFALLKEHKGPMIVAGDFNSWNKKRTQKLYKLMQKLSLLRVDFEDKGVVKSFMSNELDHIFYRDLELLEAEVINNHKLSDHNPLFARFEKSES